VPGTARRAAQGPAEVAVPLCRVVRQPEEIAGPAALRELYRFWSAARDGDSLPGRGQIDVFSLRPWLGYLSLVEPTEEGDGFRYRLFGSELANALLCEMTAGRVDELPTPNAGFILESYRLARREGLAVFTCHDADLQSRPYRWYRLVLPLEGPAGPASLQFLTAAYPEFGIGEPLSEPPPSL